MNRNQMIADRIDKMELSDRARAMIEQTDFNMLDELFGGMSDKQLQNHIEAVASMLEV